MYGLAIQRVNREVARTQLVIKYKHTTTYVQSIVFLPPELAVTIYIQQDSTVHKVYCIPLET